MNKTLNRSFNEDNKFGKRGTVKTKKDKLLNIPNKNSDAKKIQKSSSSQSIVKLGSLRITNVDNTNNKLKKKLVRKKTLKLNKKLNAISKNIRNMSNSINNPNEFYMNFFNSIIQKKNRSTLEEEKDEKIKRNYSPVKDIKTVVTTKGSKKMVNMLDDEKSKNN